MFKDRVIERLCVALGVLAVAWLTIAYGAAPATPPLPQAKPSTEQGLTLTFTQNSKTDVRPARLIALYVPESQPATPFLVPGKFAATWSGFLNQRLRGEVTFSVLGRGQVTVKVGGKVVLEAAGEHFAGKSSGAVRLEKGRNPIEVVYTSPAKGDAWVRLLWASREWPAEPVQPGVLSHDVSDNGLREGVRLREGRELLANLRCVKCHEYAVPHADSDALAMPELGADSPSVEDIGARLKEPWMAAWIANPRAMRPDASMPRMFHGQERKVPREAADLAAYLAMLGKPAAAEQKEGDDEMVTQGGQLFAALGCIGCHTRPDVEEIDAERKRVPLKWANAKFQPGALRAWLMEPQKYYHWTRMPNFHLSDSEADRLVAYLTRHAKGALPGDAGEVKGDFGRGQKLFVSAGCSNCHLTPALKTKPMQQLVAQSDWKGGCLGSDEAARGKAPDFGLSDEQRGSLQAIAAAGLTSLHNDVVTELAARSIRHLQCNACHSRDEVDDRWTELADEVAEFMPPEVNIEGDQNAEQPKDQGPGLFVQRNLGKLAGGDQIVISGDQSRPSLTWAGEKLRPEWSAQFIAGTVTYKPRYWLRARMPAFGVQAKWIATGLSMEHGMPPGSTGLLAAQNDLADVGQKLVSRDGGFACITCHSVGHTKAVSPFEAPGPNLIHSKDRLTKDFYMRWMRKPMRFVAGTKMPQYSEDGQSTLKDIFGGNADRQFEAIWQYMLQGSGMVPPE